MRMTVDPNTQETVISMENKEFSEFQHGLRTMWHFLSAEVMRNIQRYNLAQNVSREVGGVVPLDELSNRVRAVEALIGDPAWLDDQDFQTSILDLLQEVMKPEAVAKRRPYQALTQRIIDAQEDVKRLRDDLDRMMQNYVTEQGFEDLITRVRRLEDYNRRIDMEAQEATIDEFSPPIGRGELDAQVALRSAFERGSAHGHKKQAEKAEKKIRDYMDRHHFSQATIQGVINSMG